MGAGYLRAPWGLLHYRCGGDEPLAGQLERGLPLLLMMIQVRALSLSDRLVLGKARLGL